MTAGARVGSLCVSSLGRVGAIAGVRTVGMGGTIAFVVLVVMVAAGLLGTAPAAGAAFDPAAVFTLQCAGCHSVGKGEVVGPDLQGVTARRDRRWLHSFIRSSQGLVGQGETTAAALFARYKKRMPDHDFSDGEIDSLLAFIAAGGPRGSEGDLRRASMATPAEVARGRALFTGGWPLKNRRCGLHRLPRGGRGGALARRHPGLRPHPGLFQVPGRRIDPGAHGVALPHDVGGLPRPAADARGDVRPQGVPLPDGPLP
jgi:mono/diheme cytochrome c family protein